MASCSLRGTLASVVQMTVAGSTERVDRTTEYAQLRLDELERTHIDHNGQLAASELRGFASHDGFSSVEWAILEASRLLERSSGSNDFPVGYSGFSEGFRSTPSRNRRLLTSSIRKHHRCWYVAYQAGPGLTLSYHRHRSVHLAAFVISLVPAFVALILRELLDFQAISVGFYAAVVVTIFSTGYIVAHFARSIDPGRPPNVRPTTRMHSWFWAVIGATQLAFLSLLVLFIASGLTVTTKLNSVSNEINTLKSLSAALSEEIGPDLDAPIPDRMLAQLTVLESQTQRVKSARDSYLHSLGSGLEGARTSEALSFMSIEPALSGVSTWTDLREVNDGLSAIEAIDNRAALDVADSLSTVWLLFSILGTLFAIATLWSVMRWASVRRAEEQLVRLRANLWQYAQLLGQFEATMRFPDDLSNLGYQRSSGGWQPLTPSQAVERWSTATPTSESLNAVGAASPLNVDRGIRAVQVSIGLLLSLVAAIGFFIPR